MADNNNILDEEEYDPDIITLTNDDGEEYVFEVIDAADFNDIHYLAVVPYKTDAEDIVESDTYLTILRTEEDADGEFLMPLDDEEDADELRNVSSLFAERLQDVFDLDPEDFE